MGRTYALHNTNWHTLRFGHVTRIWAITADRKEAQHWDNVMIYEWPERYDEFFCYYCPESLCSTELEVRRSHTHTKNIETEIKWYMACCCCLFIFTLAQSLSLTRSFLRIATHRQSTRIDQQCKQTSRS